MNVRLLSFAVLFSVSICHANPANDIVIGFNCTGFTTATQIFSRVESVPNTKKPWWNFFSSNIVLDVSRTYPPIPNETCSITCIRVQDLTGAITLAQKVAGGVGDHFVMVRVVSKPGKGLEFNVTIDAICNQPVTIDDGQLVVLSKPDPLEYGAPPMAFGWIRPTDIRNTNDTTTAQTNSILAIDQFHRQN